MCEESTNTRENEWRKVRQSIAARLNYLNVKKGSRGFKAK